MAALRRSPIAIWRPDIRAERSALTAHASRIVRRPPPPSAAAQFLLRAAFLAATGTLLVIWLAAA